MPFPLGMVAAGFDPGDQLRNEAVWLLRASTGTGENEGTAGAALDGSVVYVDGAVEKAAGFGGSESQAATCPDAAAIDLVAGFVVLVDFDPADWTPADPYQFLAKPLDGGTATGETDDCYAIGLGTDGVPFIEWTRDGETVHNGPAFTTGNGADVTADLSGEVGRKTLCWEFIGDNGAGGWTARMYDADAGTDATTPDGVGLTQLSEIVNTVDGAQAIETSTEALRVGDFFAGAVYRCRLYDTMTGDLLRDFHPDGTWAAGTTMVATTGETWSNLWVLDQEAFVTATIPDDPALDIPADADATLAFWFTTPFLADVDGEQYIYVDRGTGTFGFNANGIRLTDIKFDAFFADFFGLLCGDGTDIANAVDNAGWAPGTRLVVITVDRATDTLTLYRDGVSHATADISAVGAIDPAADLVLANAAHLAAAKWDALLEPADVAPALGA